MITGLTASGLVLQNNGNDDLTVASGDSTFLFKTASNNNATYLVTVSTQPTGLTCTVTNGAGTIATAHVTNVTIACSASSTSSSTSSSTNSSITTTIPTLTYTNSTFNLTTFTAMTTETPAVTNSPTSCTSTPALPSGLSLSTNCAISGTPTLPQSSTSYSITAANANGNSTAATVSIVTSCSTGGFSAGGYCWHAGTTGASCDATCTAVNTSATCNATAVDSHAGKGGTLANCNAILVGLSLGTGATADSGGTAEAIGCSKFAIGRIRATANTSTCSATKETYFRACPCN